jgi:hypothetical protein
VRIGVTFVAALGALEHQGVLPEFIAEFLNSKFRRHGEIVAVTGLLRPSSTARG